MSLLTPLALLGLLTIPAILLLHLLRSRREQMPVPGLLLWRGLEQQRQGGLPRTIPVTLMLLLQLVAAAALTLALARPVLSFLPAPPRQTIFILDMTTSMLAEDASQPGSASGTERRFEAARQMLRQALEAIGKEDTFAVIGLDAAPRILLSGTARQKAEALRILDSLVPGATGADLPAALTLANGLIRADEFEPQIVIFTDAAFVVPDDPLPPVSAPVTWRIIPPEAGPVSNQALLNVSAAPLPDGRHRLFVRLVNFGDTPVTRTLHVVIGQNMVAEAAVQLAPQAEAVRVWNLPAQANTATVEIVEPDVLPLDNRAELWLTGATIRRVLLVSASPDLLARTLEAQPDVALTVMPPDRTDYNPAAFDLLVFDGLPPDLTAWPPGSVLVVNPPEGHPLLAVEKSVSNLRPAPSDAALLAGVDLSGVYFGRAGYVSLPDWAVVDLQAGTADGSTIPLIFHGTAGDARLVVWAFDLRRSNLPGRLALPLLTANTLAALLTPAPPPVVLMGQPVALDGPFSVELPGGRRQPADPQTGGRAVFTHTRQPGLYTLYNAQNRPVAGFAVHAGSALESNLTRRVQPDALNLTVLPAALPPPDVAYEEFWPWLAALTLLVVTVEGWLVWRR